MNIYYIKYKNEDNKYQSTLNIMQNYIEEDIIIKNWYTSSNIGIIILESYKNILHIKLKLSKYFNIIDIEQIQTMNDWLNDFENK